MEAVNIILGLVLLVFGRKLFWAFVGILGFIVGIEFGASILADQPVWMTLIVAAGCGMIGIVLALMVQRIAFALAGFYAGGFLAIHLAQLFSTGNELFYFLLGGIIGGVIAALVMDSAIIVLSSLVGAGAVVDGLPLAQPLDSIIFVALMITGLVVQTRMKNARDRVAANGKVKK